MSVVQLVQMHNLWNVINQTLTFYDTATLQTTSIIIIIPEGLADMYLQNLWNVINWALTFCDTARTIPIIIIDAVLTVILSTFLF